MLLAGETDVFVQQTQPLSVRPPQISHELVWNRNLASAPRNRHLTTWTKTRLKQELNYVQI